MRIDSAEYYRGLFDNPADFDKLHMYKNVNDLLNESCDLFSGQVCLQYLSGSKTYLELKNDVEFLAKVLAKNGVKKNDVVGLVFRNEYDFVSSFFACLRLGAIAALLPASLPPEVIQRLSFVFNYKHLMFNDYLAEKFAGIESLVKVNASQLDKNEQYDELPTVEVNPDDPACIVFTGGTTGNPKGALLSHKNLCRGALNGTYVTGKAFGHRYLSLIPFTHIFGLVKNLLTVFISGSTLYLCPNPANFAKEAPSFAPDTMVLTPGLGSMVLTLMKTYSPKMFGPNFKTIIAGGANVPPKLIKDFYELGIDCLPGYGLTEATNLVSGNASILTKPDSVGIAYPGQELKVVDGELYVKGDNVFLGYYGNEAATKQVLVDGWLHTGDLARIDEEGYIYILGRINNLIVLSSGLKIVPESLILTE